ncbi:MAG TPA: family 20 glycosylhydrolase [Verrucomicrobiae bacterium]|nr:family 20 glycosylhydrolase [Verrucomicrobiae bacterium]
MIGLRLFLFLASAAAFAQSLPIRGIHVSAPAPDEIPLAERFIKEALPKQGANTLVIEFNYHYQFTTHPEIVDNPALSADDVRRLVAACRSAGIRLIPMINLLGHQSWARATFALLRTHPEFDETPGKFPQNEGTYCRSYCPLHPDLHKVIFDLIDELAAVTEADAFHAGMDEVFLIGDDACSRCKGRSKADLFAGEVSALHDHLAAAHREMWMWGDRFLDGEVTGMGEWEASKNGTAPAIHSVPKDIVICDWHYRTAHPSAAYFALEGFNVLSAPWRDSSVALRQLDLIRLARANSAPQVAARLQGVLQTTWVSFGAFAKTWFGDETRNTNATEAAATFRELFRELRK